MAGPGRGKIFIGPPAHEVLGLKAYKAQQPKISENSKKRVEFRQKLRNWKAEDFSRVIWSDESMFELEHSFNPQNDRE